ncbi:Adenine-specific methyltransferase [Streptococcus constellatus]|nr:Adenine-specific methyltransferase [Streptococcus constellatus]
MNFEKIEQAYSLLLENVQELQNTLLTNFYDALVEQNGVYLDGNTELATVKKNNEILNSLKLSKEEWRRSYQFFTDESGSNGAFASQSSIYSGFYWFYRNISH